MSIGLKTWRPMWPPAPHTWGNHDGLTIRWPVTFKTRESLEGFVEALEKVAPGGVTIEFLSSQGFIRDSRDMDVVHSVAELFEHTERPLYGIEFVTGLGRISINNKDEVCTVSPAPNPEVGTSAGNGRVLAEILSRYATAKWAIPRLRLVKVVTKVPAAEARNRTWEITVGSVSVFLGGLAGVLGGVLTK
ncbi:hypothetical protein [Arthrobacter sp. ok362]|uniref:hypothetical protein n=1 Tax=Arthrobacter sp. ok362 TaxID=1761745 RepID=UPI000884603F|nr:hypothetical protein [Arthrobacter sp. ok362]SDK80790.1 hypothetical protein SAMN04487913_103245 [Arthrobacter sp. ok362]